MYICINLNNIKVGCHTWFYKRVERSYEEAKVIYITDSKKTIQRWEEICNNVNDKSRIAYQWTQEQCERNLSILCRQLRMVEKRLCKVAVMNHQPDDENGTQYQFIRGNLYCTNDSLPHNIFRVRNYPEDNLLSFQDTMRFCRVKYNVSLNDDQIERLRKFWYENPDGLIQFG